MIGEIGGQLEADAAKWIKATGNKKPVVGFIAGETAPKGRTMGHAGAIVGGSEDTAEAKKRIMRECGIHVVDSPAQIGAKVAEGNVIIENMKLLEEKLQLLLEPVEELEEVLLKYLQKTVVLLLLLTVAIKKLLMHFQRTECQGVQVKGYQSNAANFKQAQKLVEDVLTDFGSLDILINNAGITKDNLLMRMSEEDFDQVIEVNLKSIFNMTKAYNVLF